MPGSLSKKYSPSIKLSFLEEKEILDTQNLSNIFHTIIIELPQNLSIGKF